MSRIIVLLLIISVCLSGCAAAPEETTPPDTPTPEAIPTDAPTLEPIPTDAPTLEASSYDKVIIAFDNLYPEGLEFEENGDRFLVGSPREMTIFQVIDDGSMEPFLEMTDSLGPAGFEIDRNNQRLLVASNKQSGLFSNESFLNSYDLATGERVFSSDIGSIKSGLMHYLQDVTVDSKGNAYVTDWAEVYRVDLEGNASLFMEHTLLDSLNGIVYHPDGFLLLGSNPGLLLKIPLDTPEVIEVNVPEDDLDFENINGMLMHPDGTLIMVTFPDSDIVRLESDDGWETAQVVGRSTGHAAGYGTELALRGEEVYIIYSHLNRLEAGAAHSIFEIVRVEFE